MLRLKECITRAREKGYFRRKGDLAIKMWTGSTEKSSYMNFVNLESGKSKKIDIASVPIICKECNVSADYLFGLTDIPNYDENKEDRTAEITEKKETIVEKMNEIAEIVESI